MELFVIVAIAAGVTIVSPFVLAIVSAVVKAANS